jgi:hypothetical protein
VTKLGWTGVGVLGKVGKALLDIKAFHVTLAGLWFVFTTLAASLMLAIYSRGFRLGPARMHRAAFATGIVGMAMPVVIALINV